MRLVIPASVEAKRLCALMHAMVRDYARSLELLEQVRAQAPADADVLFSIATCHRELKDEDDRNLPYHEGLKMVVMPDTTVFEIGTGSGLLAMMAARLGARKVSPAAVDIVARNASKIVEQNACGY